MYFDNYKVIVLRDEKFIMKSVIYILYILSIYIVFLKKFYEIVINLILFFVLINIG